MRPASSGKALRILASLKVAIPLLVVLTAVTVIGSLFPQPELFQSWWYLGLLGLLGLSLLLITILHIPRILRRKGRNALIGVITTHAGILVLIVAAIYGGTAASRWQFRAIEGEMTVVPGMAFVIELVSLDIEEYAAGEFPGMNLEGLPAKRQDSRVRLYQLGQAVAEFVAAPGRPGGFDGYTLLPSLDDTGWVFELLVSDPLGRTQTTVIRPWLPPILMVGERQLMAHPVGAAGNRQVQLFELDQGQPRVMGTVGSDAPLEVDGFTVSLGDFHRYTGMSLYNRPHMPLLVLGVLLMLAGLIWHFYHRYRD